MDLRQLRHLVVLARHKSYTRAAETLGISQPTLTRSIQAIEAKANMRIFDRDRSGVYLTAVGKDVVYRASALLEEYTEFEHLLERTHSAQSGLACFGMAPLSAHVLLKPLVSRMLRETPDLQTRAAVRSVDALLELLSDEDIEFFISPENSVPASSRLKRTVLGRFPTSFLVRSGHPLLGRENRDKLHSYPVLHSLFFGHGFVPPVDLEFFTRGPVHVIEDYEVLASLAVETDSIWFTSAFAAMEEIACGKLQSLHLRLGHASDSFRMMMFSRERRSLSPSARFIKLACEQTISGLNERLREKD